MNKSHYTDILTARAYCTAMFGQTIEFHLWEDDAPEGGHNAEINKNNRHNKAYPARVNIDGIAEAVISLAADQNVLKQIANRVMMKGDKDEGQYHEFYLTVSYDGKILNANQTNVDVINPDYKKEQPKPKSTSTPTKPAPSSKKDESLVAKSINFVIDAVVDAFETSEKTKSLAMVKEHNLNLQKLMANLFAIENLKKRMLGNLLLNCLKVQKIWEGQALKGGEIAECNINDKSFAILTKELNNAFMTYKINTCAQKMHFLAQVCVEFLTKLATPERAVSH